MTSKLPLYYAIMRHFADGKPDCAEGVMQDLRTDYGSYKLFTRKDIEEALATAKENGLLNECDWTPKGNCKRSTQQTISARI